MRNSLRISYGGAPLKRQKELLAEIERLRTWLGDSEMTVSKLRAALEEIVNWKTSKLHWEDIARNALANEGGE